MTMPTEEEIQTEIKVRANLESANRPPTETDFAHFGETVKAEVAQAIIDGIDPKSLWSSPALAQDFLEKILGVEPEPEQALDEDPFNVPIESAEVTFIIRVNGARTVGDVLDAAAINLARYGLDSLNLMVTDVADPSRQWLVNQDGLREMTEVLADIDKE